RMAARLGAGDRAGAHAEEAGGQAGAWDRVEAASGGQKQRAGGAGRIVNGAGVMRRDHELGTAPRPGHAPALHAVGEPSLRPIGIARVDAEDEVAEIRVDDAALRSHGAEAPRLFERERRREAVAILRRISEDLPAAVTGIARVRSEERARRRRIEVVE